MDAEGAATSDDYEQLCQLRDSIKEQARRCALDLRKRLAEMDNGNRQLRRRARPARSKIDAFEAWFDRRIDEEFQKLSRGYRPEFGAMLAVQEEAAARIAAIFS